MESYLPSEIARLVYGYLKESECNASARTFLEHSPHLIECSRLQKQGRKFITNINGKSLIEILDEYSVACHLVQEFVKLLEHSTAMLITQQQPSSLIDQLNFLFTAVKSGKAVTQDSVQASSSEERLKSGCARTRLLTSFTEVRNQSSAKAHRSSKRRYSAVEENQLPCTSKSASPFKTTPLENLPGYTGSLDSTQDTTSDESYLEDIENIESPGSEQVIPLLGVNSSNDGPSGGYGETTAESIYNIFEEGENLAASLQQEKNYTSKRKCINSTEAKSQNPLHVKHSETENTSTKCSWKEDVVKIEIDSEDSVVEFVPQDDKFCDIKEEENPVPISFEETKEEAEFFRQSQLDKRQLNNISEDKISIPDVEILETHSTDHHDIQWTSTISDGAQNPVLKELLRDWNETDADDAELVPENENGRILHSESSSVTVEKRQNLAEVMCGNDNPNSASCILKTLLLNGNVNRDISKSSPLEIFSLISSSVSSDLITEENININDQRQRNEDLERTDALKSFCWTVENQNEIKDRPEVASISSGSVMVAEERQNLAEVACEHSSTIAVSCKLRNLLINDVNSENSKPSPSELVPVMPSLSESSIASEQATTENVSSNDQRQINEDIERIDGDFNHRYAINKDTITANINITEEESVSNIIQSSCVISQQQKKYSVRNNCNLEDKYTESVQKISNENRHSQVLGALPDSHGGCQQQENSTFQLDINESTKSVIPSSESESVQVEKLLIEDNSSQFPNYHIENNDEKCSSELDKEKFKKCTKVSPSKKFRRRGSKKKSKHKSKFKLLLKEISKTLEKSVSNGTVYADFVNPGMSAVAQEIQESESPLLKKANSVIGQDLCTNSSDDDLSSGNKTDYVPFQLKKKKRKRSKHSTQASVKKTKKHKTSKSPAEKPGHIVETNEAVILSSTVIQDENTAVALSEKQTSPLLSMDQSDVNENDIRTKRDSPKIVSVMKVIHSQKLSNVTTSTTSALANQSEESSVEEFPVLRFGTDEDDENEDNSKGKNVSPVSKFPFHSHPPLTSRSFDASHSLQDNPFLVKSQSTEICGNNTPLTSLPFSDTLKVSEHTCSTPKSPYMTTHLSSLDENSLSLLPNFLHVTSKASATTSSTQRSISLTETSVTCTGGKLLASESASDNMEAYITPNVHDISLLSDPEEDNLDLKPVSLNSTSGNNTSKELELRPTIKEHESLTEPQKAEQYEKCMLTLTPLKDTSNKSGVSCNTYENMSQVQIQLTELSGKCPLTYSSPKNTLKILTTTTDIQGNVSHTQPLKKMSENCQQLTESSVKNTPEKSDIASTVQGNISYTEFKKKLHGKWSLLTENSIKKTPEKSDLAAEVQENSSDIKPQRKVCEKRSTENYITFSPKKSVAPENVSHTEPQTKEMHEKYLSSTKNYVNTPEKSDLSINAEEDLSDSTLYKSPLVTDIQGNKLHIEPKSELHEICSSLAENYVKTPEKSDFNTNIQGNIRQTGSQRKLYERSSLTDTSIKNTPEKSNLVHLTNVQEHVSHTKLQRKVAEGCSSLTMLIKNHSPKKAEVQKNLQQKRFETRELHEKSSFSTENSIMITSEKSCISTNVEENVTHQESQRKLHKKCPSLTENFVEKLENIDFATNEHGNVSHTGPQKKLLQKCPPLPESSVNNIPGKSQVNVQGDKNHRKIQRKLHEKCPSLTENSVKDNSEPQRNFLEKCLSLSNNIMKSTSEKSNATTTMQENITHKESQRKLRKRCSSFTENSLKNTQEKPDLPTTLQENIKHIQLHRRLHEESSSSSSSENIVKSTLEKSDFTNNVQENVTHTEPQRKLRKKCQLLTENSLKKTPEKSNPINYAEENIKHAELKRKLHGECSLSSENTVKKSPEKLDLTINMQENVTHTEPQRKLHEKCLSLTENFVKNISEKSDLATTVQDNIKHRESERKLHEKSSLSENILKRTPETLHLASNMQEIVIHTEPERNLQKKCPSLTEYYLKNTPEKSDIGNVEENIKHTEFQTKLLEEYLSSENTVKSTPGLSDITINIQENVTHTESQTKLCKKCPLSAENSVNTPKKSNHASTLQENVKHTEPQIRLHEGCSSSENTLKKTLGKLDLTTNMQENVTHTESQRKKCPSLTENSVNNIPEKSDLAAILQKNIKYRKTQRRLHEDCSSSLSENTARNMPGKSDFTINGQENVIHTEPKKKLLKKCPSLRENSVKNTLEKSDHATTLQENIKHTEPQRNLSKPCLLLIENSDKNESEKSDFAIAVEENINNTESQRKLHEDCSSLSENTVKSILGKSYLTINVQEDVKHTEPIKELPENTVKNVQENAHLTTNMQENVHCTKSQRKLHKKCPLKEDSIENTPENSDIASNVEENIRHTETYRKLNEECSSSSLEIAVKSAPEESDITNMRQNVICVEPQRKFHIVCASLAGNSMKNTSEKSHLVTNVQENIKITKPHRKFYEKCSSSLENIVKNTPELSDFATNIQDNLPHKGLLTETHENIPSVKENCIRFTLKNSSVKKTSLQTDCERTEAKEMSTLLPTSFAEGTLENSELITDEQEKKIQIGSLTRELRGKYAVNSAKDTENVLDVITNAEENISYATAEKELHESCASLTHIKGTVNKPELIYSVQDKSLQGEPQKSTIALKSPKSKPLSEITSNLRKCSSLLEKEHCRRCVSLSPTLPNTSKSLEEMSRKSEIVPNELQDSLPIGPQSIELPVDCLVDTTVAEGNSSSRKPQVKEMPSVSTPKSPELTLKKSDFPPRFHVILSPVHPQTEKLDEHYHEYSKLVTDTQNNSLHSLSQVESQLAQLHGESVIPQSPRSGQKSPRKSKISSEVEDSLSLESLVAELQGESLLLLSPKSTQKPNRKIELSSASLLHRQEIHTDESSTSYSEDKTVMGQEDQNPVNMSLMAEVNGKGEKVFSLSSPQPLLSNVKNTSEIKANLFPMLEWNKNLCNDVNSSIMVCNSDTTASILSNDKEQTVVDIKKHKDNENPVSQTTEMQRKSEMSLPVIFEDPLTTAEINSNVQNELQKNITDSFSSKCSGNICTSSGLNTNISQRDKKVNNEENLLSCTSEDKSVVPCIAICTAQEIKLSSKSKTENKFENKKEKDKKHEHSEIRRSNLMNNVVETAVSCNDSNVKSASEQNKDDSSRQSNWHISCIESQKLVSLNEGWVRVIYEDNGPLAATKSMNEGVVDISFTAELNDDEPFGDPLIIHCTVSPYQDLYSAFPKSLTHNIENKETSVSGQLAKTCPRNSERKNEINSSHQNRNCSGNNSSADEKETGNKAMICSMSLQADGNVNSAHSETGSEKIISQRSMEKNESQKISEPLLEDMNKKVSPTKNIFSPTKETSSFEETQVDRQIPASPHGLLKRVNLDHLLNFVHGNS
ncbi:golgin subfamily B member 1-like isoform X2 [Periplaneta americana]|uniref:golgin subfamily B member 1-like isoform X2 n=1 Tax=Periplaneta americana TaxID=6978 RepID=UPI0037E98833